jgi:hypothetical protein
MESWGKQVTCWGGCNLTRTGWCECSLKCGLVRKVLPSRGHRVERMGWEGPGKLVLSNGASWKRATWGRGGGLTIQSWAAAVLLGSDQDGLHRGSWRYRSWGCWGYNYPQHLELKAQHWEGTSREKSEDLAENWQGLLSRLLWAEVPTVPNLKPLKCSECAPENLDEDRNKESNRILITLRSLPVRQNSV